MFSYKEGQIVFHQGNQTFYVSGAPVYIEDILPETSDVENFMLKPFDSASFTSEIIEADSLLLKMMVAHLPSKLKHFAYHHPKARVRKKNRARLLKM